MATATGRISSKLIVRAATPAFMARHSGLGSGQLSPSGYARCPNPVDLPFADAPRPGSRLGLRRSQPGRDRAGHPRKRRGRRRPRGVTADAALRGRGLRFSRGRGLRVRGHDVLTAQEDGQTAMPDAVILARAFALGRVVLTHNRRHYVRLHRRGATHVGILDRVAGFRLPARRVDRSFCGHHTQLPQEFWCSAYHH